MTSARPCVRPGCQSARRLALRLALAGPALCGLAGCRQELLYHPRRMSAAEFSEHVRLLCGPQARILPGFDAVVLEPDPPGGAAATAIWFHGNAGNGIYRGWAREPFASRGIRLVLAEYPGYAARPGRPSERALVDDAIALAARVRAEYPDAPHVLVGESLGAAVAVQAAVASGPSRLVLITPFDDLARLVGERFGAWAVRLVGDRYDSATHLARYEGGPVAILVAGRDSVVGSEGGSRLHDVARAHGDASLVRVVGAGHNDWPQHITQEQWTRLLGIGPPGGPSSGADRS